MLDELQNEKFKASANTLTVIWNNQVELSKAQDKLDEKLAVLARMSIRRFNELFLRIDPDEVIDEKRITEAFLEWGRFKARPDFRKYVMEWFLGVDIDKLPPFLEIKEGGRSTTPSPEAGDQKVVENHAKQTNNVENTAEG